MVNVIVFVVAAAIVLGGALGVVLNANPVRSALSLVASFFGVAVLFVLQEAHFLALVQVVVYAGAIVVLFLFVIMLLGVDEIEDLSIEPLAGQRFWGVVAGIGVLAFVLGGLFVSGKNGDDGVEGAVAVTGTPSMSKAIDETKPNIDNLAADLFGRNVLAFEATALLLTIATVGAVVLVRNAGAEDLTADEPGRADR
jgi:NADH-quinone oxidoreductase subunit J